MNPDPTTAVATKAATGLLQKLFGPAFTELGQLLGDNVKVLRLRNATRNLDKVEKILNKKNIEPRKVDLKALVPYLDGVSMEEDETLQDMWASLLVNYIDSGKNLTITVYPEILKQLSSNEAQILNFIFKEGMAFPKDKEYEGGIECTREELVNLERIGLIMEMTVTYEPILGSLKTGKFEITEFGQNFIEACRREE